MWGKVYYSSSVGVSQLSYVRALIADVELPVYFDVSGVVDR